MISNYDKKNVNGYFVNTYETLQQKPATFGIQFKLKRNSNGFIIKYYLLCCLLVLIGGISFTIDPEMVAGRIGLLITLFLVISNFLTNAQVIKNLPLEG